MKTKEDLPAFCCIGCRIASAAGGSSDSQTGFLEARLLVSTFLAMGVMTFTLVLYGESLYGAASDGAMDVVRRVGRFALAALSIPVLLLLGVPLLKGAAIDLKGGRIRMDGLIVLATFAAFGLSLIHTIQDRGEVYYETATMVLVLVSFGRRLEARTRTQGYDAAKLLVEVLPKEVLRVRDNGQSEAISLEDLQVEDLVEVPPGQHLPADMLLTEGQSTLDCAHLTGEHEPQVVGAGQPVPAGALNGSGRLMGRILALPREGTLGRIQRLLDQPLPDTRHLRLLDQLAGALAAVSILLALGVFLWALQAGDAGEGIKRALSVLLVACPCALGLASPLAFRAIRVALARRGVLVHDAVALESATELDVIALDKTGTLTNSKSGEIQQLDGDEEVASTARALLKASGHPLGHGINDHLPTLEEVTIDPGGGTHATLNGKRCSAGNLTWLSAQGVAIPSRWKELIQRHDTGAVVGLGIAGEPAALLLIQQQLKPDASEALENLKRRKLDLVILSGDRASAVQEIADRLAIKYLGGLKPDQKLRKVEELRQEDRRVMMVGDGVNDAPALHGADLSVAMAEGASVARSESQVELLGKSLQGLPLFLDGAKTLRRVVVGNLLWTVAYNALAIFMAVQGRLHPLVATVAMILSSLVVSLRSARLLRFGEDEPGLSSPHRGSNHADHPQKLSHSLTPTQ